MSAGVLVDVDVPHRAVLAAEVLLHTLVHAHLHLGVEGILLVGFLGALALGGVAAAAEQETGSQQGQDQQRDGCHSPAHRAAQVGVEGGRGELLQVERLHVGAVLHLVALIVVDEGLVQHQPPAAVYQVTFRAAQQRGHGALNSGIGVRLWADHVDHLQVPLVPRLHLSVRDKEAEV